MTAEHPSGPSRIQIQTQSGCNGRCAFCPNAAVLESGLAQGRMPPELFHKIIDELAGLAPRRVSLYLMNEPLLDGRLAEFVRYVTDRIPDTATLVTTNGTHLDERCAEELIAAGLSRIKVSLQSIHPETNRRLMGPQIDAERVVRNVLTLRRLITERRAKLDLRVSMVVTTLNAHELPRTRRFWRNHGVRLVTSAVENRGGSIEGADTLSGGQMQARSAYCIRPNREMCILFNGDVVLCCVDWFRTTVLGNVARQSVAEVWNGPAFSEVRAALASKDLEKQPDICVHCTEAARPAARRRLTAIFSRRP